MRQVSLLAFMFFSCFLSAQIFMDSLLVEEEITIFYESDSYTLSIEDRKKITDYADRYKEQIYTFRLDAHTDSDGSEEYNFTLSRKRCSSIKKVLLENDISKDRIDYTSHGEKLLLKEETDHFQKAKNRRAILRVYKTREFISFAGSISPEDQAQKISGDIYMSYDDVNDKITTDPNGDYKTMLPTNTPIELNILAKNYFPLKKDIVLTSSSKVDNVMLELTKYDINNAIKSTIQFVGNKSIVLDNSQNELEYLGKSLLINDRVCVELEGHINRPNEKTVSKTSNDHALSIARSLEIYLYLVDQGIAPDRLVARGYGNSRMLFPKASTTGQQSANRRVEIKMIACDSTRLIKNDFTENLDDFRKIDFLHLYYDSKKINRHLEHAPEKVKADIVREVNLMLEDGTDPTNYSYLKILQFSRGNN